MNDKGGNAGGFIDQMNPASRQKLIMPAIQKNSNEFQKAMVFEQPKTVIELP